MALGTGAAPSRGLRPSSLVFHWQSRLGELDAYTGQSGTYGSIVATGAVPGQVLGKNSVTGADYILAGYGMPRFVQYPGQGGTTRLQVEGEVTGQAVEIITYPFPLRVMALTMFWRVWPMYAPNLDVGAAKWGLMIGTGTSGGGWLGIKREGTDWRAQRRKGATTIDSVIGELTTAVFPMDVLVTFTSGGALTIATRDSAATPVIRTGATTTDATLFTATDLWANGLLTFCGITGLVAAGGQWRYETVKIARGIRSFTDMDSLS